jgi:hypothetical protein
MPPTEAWPDPTLQAWAEPLPPRGVPESPPAQPRGPQHAADPFADESDSADQAAATDRAPWGSRTDLTADGEQRGAADPAADTAADPAESHRPDEQKAVSYPDGRAMLGLRHKAVRTGRPQMPREAAHPAAGPAADPAESQLLHELQRRSQCHVGLGCCLGGRSCRRTNQGNVGICLIHVDQF